MGSAPVVDGPIELPPGITVVDPDAAPAKRRRVAAATADLAAIPRTPTGAAAVPFTVRGVTIHSLGTVVSDRPAFHNHAYIWPVGYEISRPMASYVTPGSTVTYRGWVEDGETGPIFAIAAEDDPATVFRNETSSTAWREVLERIRQRAVSVSGPEMFLFADPTVRALVQELPGARECERYVWTDPTDEAPAAGKLVVRLRLGKKG